MEIHMPHVALLSSPGLGHIIPVIELGKRLVLQHNLKLTILVVASQTSEAEDQLMKSVMSDKLCDIVEVAVPDISDLIDANDGIVTRLRVMMRQVCPSLRSVLCSLRPSVLIVDIFGFEALSIAEELKIPKFIYVASHAWFTSLLIYTTVLDRQVQGQYVDQEEPFQIPGCSPVRPEDVFDPMLDRNTREYQEYLRVAFGMLKSDGLLLNSWEDVQHKDLESLRDPDLLGGILKVPVYGIGPLVRPAESNSQDSNRNLFDWLDKQSFESVIFVSFGSGGTLSFEQTTEVAWGLELSQQRFIWVTRPPTAGRADSAFFSTGDGGSQQSDRDDHHPSNFLPEGFLSRTKNIGVVVQQWAPQAALLSHPSVGGFLSHCGWNSTLESLTNGVPMIAWPLYAEQRMNATLLEEELGVAVRPKVLPTKKVVERDETATMVKQIMKLNNNPIRDRARLIQHSALKALSEAGSSFIALSQLAQQCQKCPNQ
ncbi:hypothetical protein L6164_020004 [Bauhinia variegata]|nr:hypothetical protein L6164_020004 [Bauhinia variegata]